MKAVIFFISISFLVPKIIDITVSVNAMTINELNSSSSMSLTTYQDFQEIYIPPNYGGPDSQHGSGTR